MRCIMKMFQKKQLTNFLKGVSVARFEKRFITNNLKQFFTLRQLLQQRYKKIPCEFYPLVLLLATSLLI